MGVYSGNDVDNTGAAEVNLQTSAGTELLGQKTSAGSVPVVLASDQSTVPVTDAALTNASQKTQIVNDGGLVVDARDISSTPVNGDIGMITNSIIYGHTTAGGGAYVEVKVTPSGALLADVTGSDVTIDNAAGAAAVNIQDGGNTITVDGTVTANQGTANTAANGWPVKITDGTDTVIVDTDGSLFAKPVPVGTHGNAWNAATVSSGNNSTVIDCQYVRTVSIFGNSSNNLNPMRVQASMDNTNYYTLTTFAISAGNFGVTIDFGARYLRLQSGQGAGFTVTATVAGK